MEGGVKCMCVCCFVFADVLSFTTEMYVQYWVFEAFEKTLQGIGLLLFCVYVYNHQDYMNQFHIKEDLVFYPAIILVVIFDFMKCCITLRFG